MDLTLLYNEFKASSGISTDTRKIQQNQLFFALRGPNFNANELAEEAYRKSARLIVIDDDSYSHVEKTYLVKDSLEALQLLASHHRDQLDIPVIGLTGSNGKTTTKELIKAVLEKRYSVQATVGNLNNHIGVPLTILSIMPHHEIAIIEMGANHIGEIAALCAIAKPTHGLITNIGKAHIGEFGGFENIVRGKSELFDYLLKNDGIAFINALDPVLINMEKRFKNAFIYPTGEFCNIKLVDADPFVRLEMPDGTKITTRLIGAYNYSNMAVALCLGKHFKVDEQQAVEAVQAYVPSNNRSQIIEAGSNTIILDAYNANPSSMEQAVKNFSQMKADKKVVILGDMLELGEHSDEEHYKLGKDARSYRFSRAIFVGPLMQSALNAFPEAEYFEDKAALIQHLKKKKITDSYILVKGSRGMALEGLVEVLKAH
jgi:UDP-N-acetylmuramoyl-tripeptide--D-alanyl-D-alanine ligase